MEKNKKLVSVIVPLYNSAAFMKKCVDSIREQTYRNLEIILVDDGSADETLSICYTYAAEDNRVKVNHSEINCGASHARNIGLAQATGDFIMFVDSDNYIDKPMIESMITCAERENADLVACGYYLNEATKYNSGETTIIPQNEIFEKYVQTLGWSVYTKLFCKKVLCKIKFDEDVYTGEDLLFSIAVMKSIYLHKIVFMSTPYYHIVTRGDSLGNTKNIRNYKSYIYVMDVVCDEYKKRNIKDMADLFQSSKIGASLSLLRMMYELDYPVNDIKQYKDSVTKNWRLLTNCRLPIKFKVGILMQLLPIRLNKMLWKWKQFNE